MKKANRFSRYLFSTLFGVLSACTLAETSMPADNPETPAVTQVEQKVANPNQLNINSASAAEIQDKLVGIGAKKAQAIVEYRDKHGKFVSVEQLTEVSGIGKATLDKSRDRIVLE